MTRQERFDRARWRCRRGMKELDVLLERFVCRALDQLADDEFEALEGLLEHPDQDILEWIASARTPSPPGMQRIVTLIRLNALGPS